MDKKIVFNQNPKNDALSEMEIIFLRKITKAANATALVCDRHAIQISQKYRFNEDITLLLCRELGLYSKISKDISFPSRRNYTLDQWDFIDKCKQWVIYNQTCVYCVSKDGNRKKIFSSLKAASSFLRKITANF